MSGVLADGKIRIGMLCFSVFLYCSLPSYGATPQQPPEQPAALDKKESTSSPVSPSIKPSTVKSPVKNEKKKAPKEGIKDTHVGPPPKNSPPRKIKVKQLSTSPRNPVDVSTGQELIPVGK